MTFAREYDVLELKFKERVRADNELFGWKGKNRSRYLPNIKPKGKVDFILVAMEPSSGGWDENGKQIVPKNFLGSGEDLIMHFCLRNYLCADGQTYHVTDVAKGGMKTKQAKKGSPKRWRLWYPLLEEEIELVAKPDAGVIALGRGVEKFLKERETPRLAGAIPHFSTNASLARTIAPQLLPWEWREFSASVRVDDIERTAQEMMQGKRYDKYRCKILNDLRKGGLTESRKELMFTYKALFTVMRGASITNWE